LFSDEQEWFLLDIPILDHLCKLLSCLLDKILFVLVCVDNDAPEEGANFRLEFCELALFAKVA
jgi:hypothetical protein